LTEAASTPRLARQLTMTVAIAGAQRRCHHMKRKPGWVSLRASLAKNRLRVRIRADCLKSGVGWIE